MNDDYVKVIRNSVNLAGMRSEVKSILSTYKDVPQISLQAPIESADPAEYWNCSVGKFKGLDRKEEEYIHPIFTDAPLINHYIKSLGMYRTRIMISWPKDCYTIHKDLSPRIHIPIRSNEDCLMLIGNKNYYLEPGKIYWTDTRHKHSAINGSDKKRIHIVGCVEK